MRSRDYRAFVEQLGDLTPGQREALMEALASKSSSEAVIAIIERGFAAAPVCGHCRSARFISWGLASGLARYQCKDCGKTFNALTGTPLAQLHRREKWLDYARALVDGVSLRKAARRCGIDLTTSFRWRHRFLKSPKSAKAKTVTGILGSSPRTSAGETFFRKSAKGSRKIKGRAARKRGEAATKAVRAAEEHDAVLIVRDRHGATADALLDNLQSSSFSAVLEPIVAKDAVLVSDGCKAYGVFAMARDILHIVLAARRGSASTKASTSRTSTPMSAASRPGWCASRGSRPPTSKATSDGAA